MRDVERRAGARFREVGLDVVADDEPMAVDELAAHAAAGRAWVAIDDEDRTVGYVVVTEVDGNAHLEQVSVDPAHQGAGTGRALIAQVHSWAVASGYTAVTLTTYADVPWNGPLYAHLGYRVLADGEIGPELAAIRAAERRHGLDVAPRVCMRLDLDG